MFFYNLAIGVYHLGIRIAALWSDKARAWVRGRKRIWEALPSTDKRVIWFHAASLGEYEQGRPVMELWRKEHPNDFILLTFYSPSGFAINHSDAPADYICYLPADGKRNAQRWFDHWDPKLAVFFKYDMWLHYIKTAHENEVPLGFISVLVRSNQFFLKPWASFVKKTLKLAAFWSCQDKASVNTLLSHGFKEVHLAGDTRVDRVMHLRDSEFRDDVMATFVRGELVLIAGSSWPKEEGMIAELLKRETEIKVIMAPHDVSEKHLKNIEANFGNYAIRYSHVSRASDARSYKVLIVDRVGWLSRLYRYGHMAFIGGGFKRGVHNTLEPVAYHLPVAFGPNHQAFHEPNVFLEMGIGYEIHTAEDLWRFVQTHKKEVSRLQVEKNAARFFKNHSGATEKNITLLKYIIQSKRPFSV